MAIATSDSQSVIAPYRYNAPVRLSRFEAEAIRSDPHGLLAFRTLANLLTEGSVSGYSEQPSQQSDILGSVHSKRSDRWLHVRSRIGTGFRGVEGDDNALLACRARVDWHLGPRSSPPPWARAPRAQSHSTSSSPRAASHPPPRFRRHYSARTYATGRPMPFAMTVAPVPSP